MNIDVPYSIHSVHESATHIKLVFYQLHLTIHVSVISTPYPAMHSEYKVIRLESEAIHVNYSYLLEHLSPDELLPQLIARRLLTPEKMRQVKSLSLSSRHKQITTILNALSALMVVGLLPTLYAALSSIPSHENISERLRQCEYLYSIRRDMYNRF